MRYFDELSRRIIESKKKDTDMDTDIDIKNLATAILTGKSDSQILPISRESFDNKMSEGGLSGARIHVADILDEEIAQLADVAEISMNKVMFAGAIKRLIVSARPLGQRRKLWGANEAVMTLSFDGDSMMIQYDFAMRNNASELVDRI